MQKDEKNIQNLSFLAPGSTEWKSLCPYIVDKSSDEKTANELVEKNINELKDRLLSSLQMQNLCALGAVNK